MVPGNALVVVVYSVPQAPGTRYKIAGMLLLLHAAAPASQYLPGTGVIIQNPHCCGSTLFYGQVYLVQGTAVPGVT